MYLAILLFVMSFGFALLLFYTGFCAGGLRCAPIYPPWVETIPYKEALIDSFGESSTIPIVYFGVFIGLWCVLGIVTFLINPIRNGAMGVAIVVLIAMFVYGAMLFPVGLARIAQEDSWSAAHFVLPVLFASLAWGTFTAAARSFRSAANTIDDERQEITATLNVLERELQRLTDQIPDHEESETVHGEVSMVGLNLETFGQSLSVSRYGSAPRNPFSLLSARKRIRGEQNALAQYRTTTNDLLSDATRTTAGVLVTIESPLRWLAQEIGPDAKSRFGKQLVEKYGS